MIRKILLGILFLASIKSAASQSRAVDWDANCRQFARLSNSTQNCEGIYRELMTSLTEEDRANIDKLFPRSKYCPNSHKVRTNACRYLQIEMATLIKARGGMECSLILGLVLSCEIDQQLYKFGMVTYRDVLRIGRFYGVENVRARPKPRNQSVQ